MKLGHELKQQLVLSGISGWAVNHHQLGRSVIVRIRLAKELVANVEGLTREEAEQRAAVRVREWLAEQERASEKLQDLLRQSIEIARARKNG